MEENKLSVQEQFDKSYKIVANKIEHAEDPNKSWAKMPTGTRRMKAKRKLAYAYVDVELFKKFMTNENHNTLLQRTRSTQLSDALKMVEMFLDKHKPGTDSKSGLTDGVLRYAHAIKNKQYIEKLKKINQYDPNYKEKKDAGNTRNADTVETKN